MICEGDFDDTRRYIADLPAVRAGDLTVCDARDGPGAVIEAVSRSEVCVSSSLHGLIVAESLGIPTIWAKVSDRLIGGRSSSTTTTWARLEIDRRLPAFARHWNERPIDSRNRSSPTSPAWSRRSRR